MKFWDHEKDEREQWLKQALTVAFFDFLLEHEGHAEKRITSHVFNNDLHRAALDVGVREGLRIASRVARGES